jgi:putative glycosyltransferase (TIGR04372 family)
MLLKLLNAIWAIPILLFIRAIRRIVHVKLFMIESHRIGAFIPQTFHLLNRYSSSARTLVLFGTYKVSNRYWLRIIKESGLPIYGWWVKYLFSWNKYLPFAKKYLQNYGSYIESFNAITTNQDFRKLIDADLNIKTSGESWLKSFGWTHNEPLICLIVRDDNYLSLNLPVRGVKNWNYHSYRDSDINTYIEAVSWLVDQGYWVIRMGRNMKQPVNFVRDKFIDYSFLKNQEDWLDIWLFSKANFTISTGVGPDIVTPLCSIPILYVNALPVNQAASFFNSIWVPKKLHWENGQPLAINDYVNMSYSSSDEYASGKIEIVDLNSSEILDYVKEFVDINHNGFKLSEIELKEQFSFWQLFYSYEKNSRYSHLKHPKAFVSPRWLENNRNY